MTKFAGSRLTQLASRNGLDTTLPPVGGRHNPGASGIETASRHVIGEHPAPYQAASALL
ncbi:hypothetical protein [Streptomyces mirabilis]|uniref:hypothetical protein n=1 Tax=Streptomyces mirabilis TaxID=68239 RepID=UPI0033FCE062